MLGVHVFSSQRRGVLAFMWAVGMPDACGGCERRDARCLVPTVLAGIGILLASLVECMPALVWAVGMANACRRGEARDRRRLVPTVLAVERRWLLRLGKRNERHANDCQRRDCFCDYQFHVTSQCPPLSGPMRRMRPTFTSAAIDTLTVSRVTPTTEASLS